MKTRYLPPHGEFEKVPADFPDIYSSRIDDDDRTDLIIEFATYFTVISSNMGGWRKGEPNYYRSEHLTLDAARKAARLRYQRDPRGCLIYAVMQYSNRPIGTSVVVEGYPAIDSPYSREARAAKRRPNRMPKSMRDMPENPEFEQPQRFFEPNEADKEEIKRKLERMTVVGKGGSKVAFKYRNRTGKR